MRLVIVNFDHAWQFARLVRRHALDVFAARPSNVDMCFRTMGGRETGELADRRSLVWGASRPRIYGDDWESLVADLIEDVKDLVDNKVEQLAIVAVVDDPDNLEATDDLQTKDLLAKPIDVLRRVEDAIWRHDVASNRTRRYVCVRESAVHHEQPRLAELIDRLLVDPDGTGREPANQVFTLRLSSLGPQDADADDRQFVLLRVVAAAVLARVLDNESAIAGTSRVSELLNQRMPLAFSILGRPVRTTSTIIAGMIASYQLHVRRAAATQREITHGEHPTQERVKGLIRQISDSLRSAESELGHLKSSDSPYLSADDKLSDDAVDDRAVLATHASTLVSESRWWNAAGERRVLELAKAFPETIGAFVDRRLARFKEYRRALDQRIITKMDMSVRQEIMNIPVLGGGLSGAAEIYVEELIRDIESTRQQFVKRVEDARTRFVGALLPERRRRSPRSVQENEFHGLALDRMESYHAILDCVGGMRSVYRGLVPKAYFNAWIAICSGALVTVLAHGMAKDFGSLPDAFEAGIAHPSLALLAAVVVGGVGGMVGLYVAARLRHRELRSAVDNLNRENETLWRQVQAMTDRAFDYITISRQLIFLDLVMAEMKRRTGEEDAEAFNLAVEDIGADAALAPASGCRKFVQEMDPQLEKLPVGRWIHHMLEPPTAFEDAGAEGAILSFDLRESQDRRGFVGIRATGAPGTFSTRSTLFTTDQTIEVIPIKDPSVDVPGADASVQP